MPYKDSNGRLHSSRTGKFIKQNGGSSIVRKNQGGTGIGTRPSKKKTTTVKKVSKIGTRPSKKQRGRGEDDKEKLRLKELELKLSKQMEKERESEFKRKQKAQAEALQIAEYHRKKQQKENAIEHKNNFALTKLVHKLQPATHLRNALRASGKDKTLLGKVADKILTVGTKFGFGKKPKIGTRPSKKVIKKKIVKRQRGRGEDGLNIPSNKFESNYTLARDKPKSSFTGPKKLLEIPKFKPRKLIQNENDYDLPKQSKYSSTYDMDSRQASKLFHSNLDDIPERKSKSILGNAIKFVRDIKPATKLRTVLRSSGKDKTLLGSIADKILSVGTQLGFGPRGELIAYKVISRPTRRIKL